MGLLKKVIKSMFITPKLLGEIGEKRIAGRLGWSNLCGCKGMVLQNLYIPKENGETTEIDLLYLTTKGIIVIESKNYSGYIFGNEKWAKWTSTLYAGKGWLGNIKVEKYHFYNPIWQNRSHIKFLRQYLGQNIKMYSFIVFSDRCEFKDVNYTSDDVCVCYSSRINGVLRELFTRSEDVLEEQQIESIYNKLLPLTNQSDAVKAKHVGDLKRRMSNAETCPRCGGKLVVRTAKTGKNIGKQFYGCSNFPKCRFTKEIN